MNFSNLSVKFFLTSILFFTLLISISLNSTVHAQSDSPNVIEGVLYDLHGSLPDGSHITEYYIQEKNASSGTCSTSLSTFQASAPTQTIKAITTPM